MARYSTGILSTGSYLPKDEVTNVEAGRRSGVEPEWIERKTQIVTRRFAAPAEATSDLAIRAGRAALEQAGLKAAQLDYLIVSTSTGDSPQPPTSYLVQSGLDALNAACLDVNVVCSGFVYATVLAHSLLALRPGGFALVVAADVYSRILDFEDYRSAVLLGDGAGAAVIGPVDEQYGIVDFSLISRGDAHRLIRVDAGGSRLPTSAETLAAGGHFFRMDGRGVREFVMDSVPPVVAGLTARAGIGLEQVDHFIPHQANGVLLGELVQRCGLGGARTHRTLERYGNVGSASVPVALDDGHRAGAFRDGDLLLLAAFGGGMSVGTCLVRWQDGAGRAAR
ncbi:MAG TPA: ketoacyl-ACP synthase III [Rugosimonospora sp.]|nr:ketoacyl-ACP synthase III [Rugosimonospora sp.]